MHKPFLWSTLSSETLLTAIHHASIAESTDFQSAITEQAPYAFWVGHNNQWQASEITPKQVFNFVEAVSESVRMLLHGWSRERALYLRGIETREAFREGKEAYDER